MPAQGTKQKQTPGERSDARARATIVAAGWEAQLTHERWVAKKIIHELEDHSTTTLYESDLTLAGLAAAVERREKEEQR